MNENQQRAESVAFAKDVASNEKLVTSLDYRYYIRSAAWYRRRAVALKIADHKCMICYSSENLSVHHRTYERLGREKMTDLVVLCWPCHDLFHRHGRLAVAE